MSLSEQRQMIEIEATMATRRQTYVHHMIGAWYEANEAGHQEDGALGAALWLGYSIDAHAHEAGADDQQHEGGQHGAPVLAHFRVAPAVRGVRVVVTVAAAGQVAVLLDQ